MLASLNQPAVGGQQSIEGYLQGNFAPRRNPNAFDLGVAESLRARKEAQFHREIGDDAVPTVEVCNWGSGFKVAALTGGEVEFMSGTSYLRSPTLTSYDRVERCFAPPAENWWMQVIDSFLDGVECEFAPDLCITPFRFRSPLDCAWALRDEAFFTDIYDSPTELLMLTERCCDQLIAMEAEIRRRHPFLSQASGGASGISLAGHGLWLNGDPVDIISEESANFHNSPSIARLASLYSIYFHHHSVGYRRASQIGGIPGLYLQSIQQDPNGPLLMDVLEELVEPSLIVPLELDVNLCSWIEDGSIERVVPLLRRGRFVLRVRADDVDTLSVCVRSLKRDLELAE